MAITGGKVGIGTSSPSQQLSLKIVGTASSLIAFSNASAATSFIGIPYAAGDVITTSGTADLCFRNETGNILFATNGNTERMRITSAGEICVGTTTAVGSGLVNIKGAANVFNLLSIQNTFSGGSFIYFINSNGTGAGAIANSAGGVLYTSLSDYRVKQDLKEYNGLEIISLIKTYDYELKSDNSRMYGVMAHELQEIIPYAVNGEKDGEHMQGVDYSKIVPILIKAVQELKAEIEELKAK